MTTRMTAHRLAQLIAVGDGATVQQAVAAQPRLLSATVERTGQSGWTPLHLAVAASSTPLVEQLAAAGADLAAQTEDGRTPLRVALEHSPDLVTVLRRLGAPVDAVSAAFLGDTGELTRALDGGTPLTDPATDVDLLTWAATGGSVATARILLDRGATPTWAAMHAAASAGSAAVVELLLGAGADVDGRDPDTGRTPLHTAVAALVPRDRSAAVVTLLLSAGADVHATTWDGASALDITRVATARRRAAAGAADGSGAADRDDLSELLVAAGATG